MYKEREGGGGWRGRERENSKINSIERGERGETRERQTEKQRDTHKERERERTRKL